MAREWCLDGEVTLTLWSAPICSQAMHRTHSKELTKQVHGDLTWNVPLELDPDFGLSLADRDRRLLAQQKQQDHPAAPAEEKQAGGGGPIAGAQQPSEAAPGVTPGADTSSMDEEPLKPELGSAPSKTDMSRLPHSMVDLQTHTLHDTSQRHLLQLITQLLQAEGAAQVDVWAPILLGLAEAAANAVSPTAMAGHGVLDPRHYVKVGTMASMHRRMHALYAPSCKHAPNMHAFECGYGPACTQPSMATSGRVQDSPCVS